MRTWTDHDYATISWHDNHIHGFRLFEGKHGSGNLIFDIDHILEWVQTDAGKVAFRIAPASLEFHDASNLKISLDYASATAALVPFSIDSINRSLEMRERYTATIWQIPVNWPRGNIAFEAAGFTLTLRSEPILSGQQYLTKDQRNVI